MFLVTGKENFQKAISSIINVISDGMKKIDEAKSFYTETDELPLGISHDELNKILNEIDGITDATKKLGNSMSEINKMQTGDSLSQSFKMGTQDVEKAVQSYKDLKDSSLGLQNAIVSVNGTILENDSLLHKFTASTVNASGGFNNFTGLVNDGNQVVKILTQELGSATNAAKSFEATTKTAFGTKISEDIIKPEMVKLFSEPEYMAGISNVISLTNQYTQATRNATVVMNEQGKVFSKNGQQFIEYAMTAEKADGTLNKVVKTVNLTTGAVYEKIVATEKDYTASKKVAEEQKKQIQQGRELAETINKIGQLKGVLSVTDISDITSMETAIKNIEEFSNQQISLKGTVTAGKEEYQKFVSVLELGNGKIQETGIFVNKTTGEYHTLKPAIKGVSDETYKQAEASKKVVEEQKKLLQLGIEQAKAPSFKISSRTDIDSYVQSLTGLENATTKVIGATVKSGQIFDQTLAVVKRTDGTFQEYIISQNRATQATYLFDNGLSQTDRTMSSVGKSLGGLIGKIAMWTGASSLLYLPLSEFKKAFDELKNVDTEMINIQKVTNATTQEMNRLGEAAYATATRMGRTASDVLKSITEFSRAGYGSQAAQLAELALLTQNAGDVTAEIANQFLLSADAGYKFGGSVQELSKILDGANQIGNEYATSLEKIAEGIGIVAPVAAQAGVGVDQLTAAIGTITAVTQRTGSEAARAFRALILNLRQVTDEILDVETGEILSSDAIKRSEKAILGLGVQVREVRNGVESLRDPMSIIAEIAEKWQVLSTTKPVAVQDFIDAVGGKMRSAQLVALIENFDMYEQMLTTYSTAAGSALRENAIYLDSWEAKTKQLQASWTQFVAGFVDTRWIKNIIDATRAFVEFADSGVGRVVVSAGLAIAGITLLNLAVTKLGASTVVTAIGVYALDVAQLGFATATKATIAPLIGQATAWAATPFGMITIAVGAIMAIVTAFDYFSKATERQTEKLHKLNESYKQTENEINSLNSQLLNTANRIDELNAKEKLSIVEETELTRLKNSNRELEIRLALLNEQAKITAQEAARAAAGLYRRTTGEQPLTVEGIEERRQFVITQEELGAPSIAALDNSLASLLVTYERIIELRDKATTTAEWDRENERVSTYKQLLIEAEKEQSRIIEELERAEQLGVITPEQIKILEELRQSIILLRKEIIPEEWAKLTVIRFDELWRSEDFEQAKRDLEELSKTEPITAESIEKVEGFKKLINETGITASEIADLVTAKFSNIGGIIGDSLTPIEEVSQKFDNLRQQFETGTLSEKKYAAALTGLQGELKRLNAQFPELTDSAEEMSNRISLAFETLPKAVFKALQDDIKDLKSAYDTLTEAEKEYKETGQLTLSTIESLMLISENYGGVISYVNGKLVFNTEKLDENKQALKEMMAATIGASAASQILAIIEEEAAKVTEESETITENTSDAYRTLGDSAIEGSKGVFVLNGAVLALNDTLAQKVSTFGEDTQARIKAVTDNANVLIGELQKATVVAPTKQKAEAKTKAKEVKNIELDHLLLLNEQYKKLEVELYYIKKAKDDISKTTEEQIELSNREIEIYRQQQQLEHERNQERRKQIQTMIDELGKRGIQIEFDPIYNKVEFTQTVDEIQNTINKINLKDIDKSNELKAKLKGYTEEIIKLNDANVKGGESWTKLRDEIYKVNLAIASVDYNAFIDKNSKALADFDYQLKAVASNDFDEKARITTRQLELQEVAIKKTQQQILDLQTAYRDGKISSADFKTETDKLTKAMQDGTIQAKQYADAISTIRLEELRKQQSELSKMVDLTKQLIQQEAKDEINALTLITDEYTRQKKILSDMEKDLNERVKAQKKLADQTKKDLDAEYKLQKDILDLRKKAIDDELKAYKLKIDLQKSSLDLEKEQRKYEQDLAEKQMSIIKIQDRLAEIQFNNSLAANAERIKLEEDLAKQRQALDNFVYDNNIENQKNALDSEYERYKSAADREKELLDNQQKELEAAHQNNLDRIVAEQEAYENSIQLQIDGLKRQGEEYDRQAENVKNQIQDIQDRIANNGELTRQAMARIDQDGDALYQKLIDWNNKYGTGIEEDIVGAWNDFKNVTIEQNGVLETTRSIMQEIMDLSRQIASSQASMNVGAGVGIREHYEAMGRDVGWNPQTSEFSIDGMVFSSQGFQNIEGHLRATQEQLEELERQLKNLPKHDTGGYMKTTHPAIVHEGELINTADQTKTIFSNDSYLKSVLPQIVQGNNSMLEMQRRLSDSAWGNNSGNIENISNRNPVSIQIESPVYVSGISTEAVVSQLKKDMVENNKQLTKNITTQVNKAVNGNGVSSAKRPW